MAANAPGHMRKYGRETTCIRLRVGEHFVLELPAKLTAGFEWVVSREPASVALSAERRRPGGPGVGASSFQELEFAANGAGAGTVVLEYKRPWEDAVEERLELEIVVDA